MKNFKGKKVFRIYGGKVKNEFLFSNYIGVFLISMAVLVLEFNLTRVLSVSMWYNFAFMIISVALLGFGISGVFLAKFKTFENKNINFSVSILSILFGISVILSFYLMNRIPLDPFSLLSDRIQLIYLPAYYLLITIPFFFGGLIIALLITTFKEQVHSIYFSDLLGAGLACIVFIISVPLFGGGGTIAVISVMGFVAAIIFSYNNYKKLSLVALALIIILLIAIFSNKDILKINVSPNKKIVNLADLRPDLKILTEWNSFSKVDVVSDEEEPADGYRLYIGVIDAGNANTNIPFVKSLPITMKPADASNLAFANKPYGTDSTRKVFIIGSAGGGEILVSLYHKAKKIIGVEINSILNDLIANKLSYWTGPLVKNNKSVELITNDARAEINKREEMFDVIISAHTISSSAVSSGAMNMVENYILTKEAVREYVDKLTDSGILYISRPETQLFKLITTLKTVDNEIFNTTSDDNSIFKTLDTNDFKRKIICFRRKLSSFEVGTGKSFLAGVIYKKSGFNDDEVTNIRSEAIDLNLEVLYYYGIDENYFPSTPDLKRLVETDNLTEEIKQVKSVYNLDINPATDNKPFFDNNIGFAGLNFQNIKEVLSQDEKAIFALKDKPVAEVTIIILLIQIVFVSFLFLILPFVFKKRSSFESDKQDNLKTNKKLYFLYFSLLGLGYIMLQISMMQKFTIFLGQPVYTMLTVISTMLIASGIGSRISRNLSNKNFVIVFSLIVLICLFIGFVVPSIFYKLIKLDLILRILFSIMIIFPLGFLMGMPFPAGIYKLNTSNNNKIIPLCWALNGFFSVTGTALTVMIAMIVGFKLVFVIAAMIYLLAFLLFRKFI
ncbi:MAG: hypothetical protein N2490_03735 [Ignavibacteria bacterium]|nr:hypothetical protein [Ignavibacteria bacterium]